MLTKTKKIIIIIVAILLVVSTATGITLAYIITDTSPVENSFTRVYVSCEVEENFDKITKSNVKIKNTGDITAYIRATFIVTWTDDNNNVLGQMPVKNTDYSLTLGSDKWALGSDGFYYYTVPVAAGTSTEILISAITLINTAPSGYSLSVHVAGTAIQAEPEKAVTSAWNVQIQSNGTLVAP